MDPKLISIADLLHNSHPLSGASSLTPQTPTHHHHTPSTAPPQTLPSLTHPTLITGTLNLPTNPNLKCNCFSFSDHSSTVCCAVLGPDVITIIGKKIHVTAWNFVPLGCGKSGLLEIIRWSVSDVSDSIITITRCSNVNVSAYSDDLSSMPNSSRDGILEARSRALGRLGSISPGSVSDSVSRITRCSNVNVNANVNVNVSVYPDDLSSLPNSSWDDAVEARSRALGRLGSVSPVTVVPCTRKDQESLKGSGERANSSGFLAELLVCRCKLCRSKASAKSLCDSLGEESGHLFDVPVVVYFFQSTSTWHPLLSKLLGKVVCVTGLKKKQIFFGKDESCLMFITTEKATVYMPLLAPKCCPVQRVEMKWMGESGAYTGVVTGIYMQGMAVELDEKVWLLLTDQALAPPHSVRVGAIICARNVHFIRPRFSWTRTLLLGACFKASINVKFFSPLDSQCHIRLQTQSMLGKFIDSLVFSARFWLLLTVSSFKKIFASFFLRSKLLLLTVSSFKKIFASFFTEKEILGTKQKEGLAQMYAKLHLPSCAFQPRRGVFMEFCNHGVCGCGNEPDYNNLKLVVPLSSFISHCETMWVNSILPKHDNRDPVNKNHYWCNGKSYYRLIRHMMSSEDLGVVLMGTLKISSSAGRLQMVDASGSVDVVIPDLPSNYYMDNIYEVRHYNVVIEGLLQQTDETVKHENEPFSCRGIFHHVSSRSGIKPTSIYVHFYMKNTTCLNSCLGLPFMDWSRNFEGIENGQFHLLLVTHKFPTTQKFHVKAVNKLNMFVEGKIFPWDLVLPGEHKDTDVTRLYKENLKEHLPLICSRNSSGDRCHKRPKLTHGSTLKTTSTSKVDLGEAVNGSYGCFSKYSGDHKSINHASSDELPCSVILRSLNHKKSARSGVFRRANCDVIDRVVDKRPGRKVMLEFMSECLNSYQLVQVGGYYMMRYRKELHENVNDRYPVSDAKIIINSQTPLWSVSFCSDDNISVSELLQESLEIGSVRTDVVQCESSTGDLFFQPFRSQSSKLLVNDVILHLSVAAMNLLKLDIEALEDDLVKPITISGNTDNSFMFTMYASGNSSGIADPECRLPQGSLISVRGNILCVHSIDCHTVHFGSQLKCNVIGDIPNTCLSQGLPSSICIHIAKDDHMVKLRGALSNHAYPIGMGPGVEATFYQVLVMGQHELLLTPVSFIVINSMKKGDKQFSDSSHFQFGSGVLRGESLDMTSSSLFSETTVCAEKKLMRFRGRVVAIHVLLLQNETFDFGNTVSTDQTREPVINIPCAGFIIDDGSLPCCCWASAEMATMLLRLDVETADKAICSDTWKLNKMNLDKSRKTANYHLKQIFKKYHRVTIKNYGALFDSSCQDLTFSVNSDKVLSCSDENLLKLIVINACRSSVLNIVGTIMDSNGISQLEEMTGMGIAVDGVRNIWVTEVEYVNHRAEATNLIQELLN